MDLNLIKRVIKRFARAFIAGGVAQVAIVATLSPQHFSNFKELDIWLLVLADSFVVGGIMAIDKLLRNIPTTP